MGFLNHNMPLTLELQRPWGVRRVTPNKLSRPVADTDCHANLCSRQQSLRNSTRVAMTTSVTVLPFGQQSLVHLSSYYVPGTCSLKVQPSGHFLSVTISALRRIHRNRFKNTLTAKWSGSGVSPWLGRLREEDHLSPGVQECQVNIKRPCSFTKSEGGRKRGKERSTRREEGGGRRGRREEGSPTAQLSTLQCLRTNFCFLLLSIKPKLVPQLLWTGKPRGRNSHLIYQTSTTNRLSPWAGIGQCIVNEHIFNLLIVKHFL